MKFFNSLPKSTMEVVEAGSEPASFVCPHHGSGHFRCNHVCYRKMLVQ